MNIRKGMSNLEIAELLRAVAASYKLKDDQKYKFQIIAYERAADSVDHASSELKDLWDEDKLEDVAGIGQSIAGHISDIFKTGRSCHFEEIMKGIPSQMFDLMVIPGIGAKTAYRLVKELNITGDDPIKTLEELAEEGIVSKLDGFGEESEKEILRSIKEIKGRSKRYILPYAEKIAEEICDWIRKEPSVQNIDTLGSLRRKVSTIGDIDIAVSSEKPIDVIEHFVSYPKAQRIIEKGNKTASIVVTPDIQIDIKVQRPGSYGSLLQHFTGSKHHNIALREYALKKGFSLSEYGIKEIKNQKSKIKNDELSNTLNELRKLEGKASAIRKFNNEESFYNYLGLAWIPPEIREENGEIKASINQFKGEPNGLPNLIELSDIKTDLQIHSDYNIETSHDLGLSSMEEIVDKANVFKYEYLALTEHNPSHGKHSQNEIIDLLKKKKESVEKLNDLYVKDVKGSIKYVFNSLEIDILKEGNLPIPEKSMEYLDFALVSIHSSFRMSKEKMTKRILYALSYPKVKIFAHPTCRKLNVREGVEIDWEVIFDYCKTNDKWIEINAEPMRLDLPDFLVKEAIKYGVKLTLGTDAHHTDHMENMKYGVSVARRGWAEKKDIINTLSFKDFQRLI